jgi:molecular chaperone DnaJ
MAVAASDDHYAWLGVGTGADRGELRRAWRRLALKWHPDRAGPAAAATFRRIAAAYAVLSDPVARAMYDRQRGAPTVVTPAAAPNATPRRAPGVLLHRLSGPLNALLACGIARHAEGDVIELFLDEEEVSEGGMVTISMYVPVRCPSCGTGTTGSCERCGGKRAIDELFSAWLAVRPGVADGTLLLPSAMLPGMVRPVSFRVRRDAAA